MNDDLLGNDDLIDCGDCATRGCRSTPNRQSNLQFIRQFNRPSPINPHSPIKNPQSIPNPQSFDPQFSFGALPPRREHARQRDAEVARQVRLQIIVGLIGAGVTIPCLPPLPGARRSGEWYVACSPEIPGTNGQGRTKEEARESLAEAIALILANRREDGLRGVPPEPHGTDGRLTRTLCDVAVTMQPTQSSTFSVRKSAETRSNRASRPG